MAISEAELVRHLDRVLGYLCDSAGQPRHVEADVILPVVRHKLSALALNLKVQGLACDHCARRDDGRLPEATRTVHRRHVGGDG